MPFWLIRRSADRKECNCDIAFLNVTTIATIGAGADVLKVSEPRVVTDGYAVLPVCTNFAALAANCELVLLNKPKGKTAAKKKPRTWMQEQEAKQVQKKTNAWLQEKGTMPQ